MIRHTSSILISLFIHTLFFIAIFYSFTNIVKPKIKEEKVCIKLCSIEQAREEFQAEKIMPVEAVVDKKIEPKKEIKKELTPPLPPAKKVEIKKVAAEKKEVRVELAQAAEAAQEAQVTPLEDSSAVSKDEMALKDVSSTQQAMQEEMVPQSVQEDDEYLQEHIAAIKKLLEENLYYPRSARKRGITGEVLVKFKLSPDASVAYIRVLSSPSEILSRGAVQTIENVSAKFPKPKKALVLEVPISYRLND
jgi:protein TonB